jgi:hypothetical protein
MSVEALRAGKSSDLRNYHQKRRIRQLFLQKRPAAGQTRLTPAQLGRKIFSASTFMPEMAAALSFLPGRDSIAQLELLLWPTPK